MKSLVKIICFFLFSAFSLQANIYEKLYFFKNFSGTYEFEFNVQKSNFIINLINKLNTQHKDLKSENYDAFHEIADCLRAINGVKHIKLAFSHDFSKIAIGFSFKNIEVLNKALDIIFGQHLRTSLTLKKGRLSRKFNSYKENIDENFDDKFNKKIFLKDIIINTEYSFENYYVRSNTTKYNKISENKRNVLFNYYLLDIISQDMEHDIYLGISL